MSLKTWKKEFYPIRAKHVSEEDAAKHSLRKWIGLRKENLDKHGVCQQRSAIYGDRDYLFIRESSCALCIHYLNEETNCKSCPLAQILGRPCDENENSEYASFVRFGNPEPMIAALEQLVEQNGEHNER